MSAELAPKVKPLKSGGNPKPVKKAQQQVYKDTQKSKIIIPKKSYDTSANQILRQIEQRDKQMEALKYQKKEQTVKALPDSLWNIYTGNPGLYSTEGDTINFGNVEFLPDSVFLKQARTATGKSNQPYGFEGKLINFPKNDWVLCILLISWILFASAKVRFSKYLDLLMGSLINVADASRLYVEKGYKKLYGALRLNVIFYLVVPLAVYQVLDFHSVNIPGFSGLIFFLILFIGINGFFLLKNIVYHAIGSVIMLEQEIDESAFNMFLFYKALGLFLLPVVTVHAIDHRVTFVTVWIMIFLIVLFYFVSILRSIYIAIQKGISIFYLILYLCLLEIMPLVLIYKIMTAA